MDIDDENVNINFKKRKFESKEDKLEAARRKKEDAHKHLVMERLKRKVQGKWRRTARVDASDRMIGNTLPKHLNSGKRGKGKTDRR